MGYDASSWENHVTLDKLRKNSGQDTNTGLCQWPLKILAISAIAPYFHRSNLLLAADCSAFTYKNFHSLIFEDRPVAIGCPMLDGEQFKEKIQQIINLNDILDITVIRMNTACCKSFASAVIEAVKNSKKDITVGITTVFTEGEIVN